MSWQYKPHFVLVLDLIKQSKLPDLISNDAGIVRILVYNLMMAIFGHHSVCFILKKIFNYSFLW